MSAFHRLAVARHPPFLLGKLRPVQALKGTLTKKARRRRFTYSRGPCHSLASGAAGALPNSPARRFSFYRRLSPLMLIVADWCSRRSRMAVARTGSLNTSPQSTLVAGHDQARPLVAPGQRPEVQAGIVPAERQVANPLRNGALQIRHMLEGSVKSALVAGPDQTGHRRRQGDKENRVVHLDRLHPERGRQAGLSDGGGPARRTPGRPVCASACNPRSVGRRGRIAQGS